MSRKTIFWIGGVSAVLLGVYVFMPTFNNDSRFTSWRKRNFPNESELSYQKSQTKTGKTISK